jgi:hypothetical protein
MKPEDYGPDYHGHLIEQYKLYVEMADRVSSRRMVSNSFFLGIHTAFATALAYLVKERLLVPNLFGLIPFVSVALLCWVWYKAVLSYQQMNSGKFKVIHELEQRLPAAPFETEWEVLGNGSDHKNYMPISKVEKTIPICFGTLYCIAGLCFYLQETITSLLHNVSSRIFG